MSLSEFDPRNLQRKADIAIANHAAEISMPMPKLNTEAATIDIANPPDPWDTPDLSSAHNSSHGVERKNGRNKLIRDFGEFSDSFSKPGVASGEFAVELPKDKQASWADLKPMLKLIKLVHSTNGVPKEDSRKIRRGIVEAHKAGKIGKEYPIYLRSTLPQKANF